MLCLVGCKESERDEKNIKIEKKKKGKLCTRVSLFIKVNLN